MKVLRLDVKKRIARYWKVFHENAVLRGKKPLLLKPI